jgi:hypothetical protein
VAKPNGQKMLADYNEDHIRSLDWREHIRTRPGMYIGKLGDGSHFDDGIYVLLKEVIDNCVDEFMMGAGRRIEIQLDEGSVSVRDYGRGIPHGKIVDCVAKINTGAKYDKGAFYRSGLDSNSLLSTPKENVGRASLWTGMGKKCKINSPVVVRFPKESTCAASVYCY